MNSAIGCHYVHLSKLGHVHTQIWHTAPHLMGVLVCSSCSVAELVVLLLAWVDYKVHFCPVSRATFHFKCQSGNWFCWSKENTSLGNSMVERRRHLLILKPEYTTREQEQPIKMA